MIFATFEIIHKQFAQSNLRQKLKNKRKPVWDSSETKKHIKLTKWYAVTISSNLKKSTETGLKKLFVCCYPILGWWVG